MKRLAKKILILGILFAFLFLILYLAFTPGSRHKWITEWLNNPTCAPPCWMGITPGETILAEASVILSHNALVKITDHSDNYLQWNIEGDYGQIVVDKQDSPISVISISIRDDQKLRLQEIISTFGSPEQLQIGDCIEDFCVVYVIYIDDGMAFTLYLQDLGVETVWVSPIAIIHEVKLFQAGSNNFENIRLFVGQPSVLIPWDGYSMYQYAE